MWPIISKFTKVLIVGPFCKFVTKGKESISAEALTRGVCILVGLCCHRAPGGMDLM